MSFHYSPKISTDGLILYLDAANTRSYPTTGTTWTDLSRSSNNGSLVNGPTFNSANGGSIAFDGINDRVLITSTSQINSIQVPMTITGWFNDNGVRTTPTIFSQYFNTAPGNLVKLVRAQSGSFVYFASNSVSPGFQVFSIPSAYTFNTWNFFSVTVDGTLTSATITLRVNNLQQTFTSTQMASPNTSVSVQVGSAANTFQQSNEFFAGRIANVSVYNKALTSTEVLQNYNTTKSRFGL